MSPACTTPAPRRRALPLVVLIAAATVAVIALPARPAAAYQDGDRLQFTGVVTDVEGKPVAGAVVALEMARRSLSWRELRRTDKDPRRIATVTNARGEYNLEWIYDSYFNHFEILAGVSLRHGRRSDMDVLEREDVTARTDAGSPVIAAVVIHNRALVDRVQGFLASLQSADERRVYDEMGTPDDVKRVAYAGRAPDRQEGREVEASWWYFDAGKVYRFRAGRLEQVDRFDPVQRF
jgi:hypothetical protein